MKKLFKVSVVVFLGFVGALALMAGPVWLTLRPILALNQISVLPISALVPFKRLTRSL
jgi:hypothetical protein